MINIQYCFSRSVIILIALTLTLCKPPEYQPNPENFLIKELSNRKILVLGDFNHAAAYPYKCLMALLNEWKEQVRTGASKDNDITLVLEMDDELVKIIKSFISDGNIDTVYKYWSPFNSLETFEFYYNLRSFVKEIDNINTKRSSTEKISFDIIGGELFNNFNNPYLFSMSQEQLDRFIITSRDSIIAKKIIDNLNITSKRKAIVFYGNAHISSALTDKRNFVIKLKNNAMGYFFAHHLKKHFGNENVLTYSPIIVANQEELRGSAVYNITENTFFVFAEDFGPTRLACDGFIIKRESVTSTHLLGDFFSLNTVNGCLDKMKTLKNKISSVYIKPYYDRALESLRLLTGKNYSEISDWEKWIKLSKYDGFQRLDSPEFAQMIEDKYFTFNNPGLKNSLLSLGINMKFLDSWVSKEEWKNIWTKTLSDIKLANAIGINLIGTEEEKAKAKQYLVSSLGNNFSNPVDYIKYYRSTVFNVSY